MNKVTSYIIQEITHICRNMKSRSPGSAGEREAADYMAEILSRECGCESIAEESFQCHPSAFYGYFFVTGALAFLCTVSFFVHPLLSIIFGGLTVLLFLFQFVLYREIIDPLFPAKESVNVTAVRSCSQEPRRRIFLCGHIDAAWEFPLNYHFGGIVFEIPGVASLSGVMVYILLSVLTLCNAGAWVRTAGLCGLIFIPFYVFLSFTCNPKQTVDGANDNLTGCLIGIALLREMEQAGMRLEHTEVGVILTGAEEAGTRGAKRWCRMHDGDYRDIPTYVLCLDTIHDPDCLMVNGRDLNSTVKADPELGRAFLKAAEEAGVPCRKGRVPLFGGSTDSAAFTKAGFRSVAVTGLSHVLEDYYHTRRDTYDNLNSQGIENCYHAVKTLIQTMDAE